jgi:polyisoprenoid-binding protein YceI
VFAVTHALAFTSRHAVVDTVDVIFELFQKDFQFSAKDFQSSAVVSPSLLAVLHQYVCFV